MKEYMKYVSDDYQDVIQIEEDPNGTFIIEKGFLPLIKIDNPDEDENTEYVAVKLILEDDNIKYQMLQADHGEESHDNIRIIQIQNTGILYSEDNYAHSSVIQKYANFLKDNSEAIDNAIHEMEQQIEENNQKYGSNDENEMK